MEMMTILIASVARQKRHFEVLIALAKIILAMFFSIIAKLVTQLVKI